jgi:hypothetical protein
MALPLIAPIGLHFVIFAPRALWRFKWSLIAVSVTALVAGVSYCSYLVHDLYSAYSSPTAAGWVFPFLGARVLSGYGLGYFFGPDWHLGDVGASAVLGRVATLVSTLAFPMVWVGIVLAAYSTFRAVRRKEPMNTQQKIALLALATLGAQIVLNGMTGTARRPHYYNGTWIIFVLFAWLCMDAAGNLGVARWIMVPYGAAQVVVLALLVAQVHRNGGSRDGYGPTVANQMQIASELKQYSPETPIRMDVLNYQQYPHALQSVRSLDPPDTRRALRNTQLAVVYASPNPSDGRIKLIEQ